MSRAALWKQESNVREREQRADDIFQQAVEEGKQRGGGVLPLWGSPDSFHFNPLLLRNIIKSPYFQKCCQDLADWNAVIDEIYYEVKFVQPFAQGRSPSTAFCLLLRLLTLRMTKNQLNLTLNHRDSPYIRAIGFLYLRYAGPPTCIIEFIGPYLHDEEEITVEHGHRGKPTTIGEFIRRLFDSREFYGTPLPRLPQQVERDVQVKILQANEIAERAFHHHKNEQRMRHFQTLGSTVMALYEDEENPLQWYKGVVDRVLTKDESNGIPYKYPRFMVTFTEYGNTETVTLGEMDVVDGRWRDEERRDSTRGEGRGYRSDRRGNDHHLYQQIRERESKTATADGGWARRPPSHHHTHNDGRRVRSVLDDSKPRPKQQRDQPRDHREPEKKALEHHKPPPKKRTAEEEAVIMEKKRKLMAKYG